MHGDTPSANELTRMLTDNLTASGLPDELKSIVLPSQDDIVNVLKQKCEKNAGNTEEWTKVEAAANDFRTCITDLVDAEVLQREIEEAQPNGELDMVFNK